MWLGPRKLVIFAAAVSECFIYAEAKYCAFEIHGEQRYYVCPRTEYCCNFGCCVSPGFQIYHLWYYWLLVIIMFLVCSGGGWWYRYWLQGRYRPSTSSISPRTPSSRAQNALRGPTCRAQQARVTYNPARNTVLLHRMWKGPQRNMTPPAYNGAAASSAQFQNTNVVLNDNNCPYYELYGPPPSYETVIAQTCGKSLSPTPLERLRSNSQTPVVMRNQNMAHCFSHDSYGSLSARIHTENGIGERSNSCGSYLEEPEENYQNFVVKNIGQKYEAQQVLRMGSNLPGDNCHQVNIASGTRPGVPQNILKKSSFCVPENRPQPRDGGPTMLNDCKSSPDGEYNTSAACASSQFAISPGINDVRAVREAEGSQLNELEVKVVETEQPSDENYIRLHMKVSKVPRMFLYSNGDGRTDGIGYGCHRAQSSSLKVRSECRERYCDIQRHKENSVIDERSVEGCSTSSTCAAASRSTNSNSSIDCEECIAQENDDGSSTSEQNPSNNVILPFPNPNFNPNPKVEINILPPINIIENYQHYPPTSSPEQRSTSTNLESENKLGRSKSLD